MDDKFIVLETPKSIKNRGFGYEHQTTIRKSLPFAESVSGRYTHRVRSAMLHKHPKSKESHISIQFWCNSSVLIGKRRLGRFVAEPTNGRPICAICEGKVIGAGLLGERKINGRDVMYYPIGGKQL